ncbi:uncharacterized protein LOC142169819 [Nicotiana tabacum]|uniref:Uncharacterized protein LOC142169819 n=1 Tax=Nicotiana tabacum TaxID=4097 RepID=A0AC58SS92_TOBAC
MRDLRKFFERLRKYDLKLNPTKYAFRVPSRKLLRFIVRWRGIELDPTKIKSIRDLPSPKSKKEVMSLLGRLNYISRFISQLTTTCEPIFKLLKKHMSIKWIDKCQESFDKIKEYLPNPSVLVPPEPGRPLFLYLTVLENSFGCVLGKHDPYGEPWYHDIKRFLKMKEYPEQASGDQKKTIKSLASSFFLSGETLYKRTPDLNLLRCVDSRETDRIMNKVHSGVCGPHMNGVASYVSALSIRCLGIDVIRPIQSNASNGHKFILVSIDYFTKWVEAVTKKVVVEFVHFNIICHFCIPKTIITDNATNLNSHLMREVYEQFKIMHHNSTAYRPKANDVVEAANKNIKKILREMVRGSG